MKRLSLASFFAAVLINVVTAVRGKATKQTCRTVANLKRLGALVARLR